MGLGHSYIVFVLLTPSSAHEQLCICKLLSVLTFFEVRDTMTQIYNIRQWDTERDRNNVSVAISLPLQSSLLLFWQS